MLNFFFSFHFLDLNRECKSLSTYQDANSARKKVMDEIKRIIEQHPLLEGKLKFPAIKNHRLQHLLNERFHSYFLNLKLITCMALFLPSHFLRLVVLLHCLHFYYYTISATCRKLIYYTIS